MIEINVKQYISTFVFIAFDFFRICEKLFDK